MNEEITIYVKKSKKTRAPPPPKEEKEKEKSKETNFETNKESEAQGRKPGSARIQDPKRRLLQERCRSDGTRRTGEGDRMTGQVPRKIGIKKLMMINKRRRGRGGRFGRRRVRRG
jgi:hypothetical protein